MKKQKAQSCYQANRVFCSDKHNEDPSIIDISFTVFELEYGILILFRESDI